jgi:hypothetical protein
MTYDMTSLRQLSGKVAIVGIGETDYRNDYLDSAVSPPIGQLCRGAPLFLSNPKGFAYGDTTEGMRVRVTFVDREDQAGPYKLPVFERDLP